MQNMQRKSGFSMLELSICLIIIGLIVGALLTGTSILRSSELRSMEKDIDKYTSAVTIFQDRFNALPGDMATAVKQWGAKAGGTTDGVDATCRAVFDTTHTPTKLTCNGDGDGMIDESGNYDEIWAAWQHLANSGIIEGVYTGQGMATSVPGAAQANPGLNAPSGEVSGSEVYTFRWRGSITSAASDNFLGEYGNILTIGTYTQANDPFLSAADMQTIDSKIDDGLPGTGNLRSYKNVARPNCSTTDDATTARYNITSTTARGCTLIFITGF